MTGFFKTMGKEQPHVQILRDPGKFLGFLLKAGKPIIMSVDYETTGLQPYRRGHRIVSCAVCVDELLPTPMAFHLDSRETRILWRKVLEDGDILKVAHNLKFEHLWAERCLGVETRGWLWDTMIVAHILDNSRGITGLKTQAKVHLGAGDYSAGARRLIVSPKDAGNGANEFNSLKDSRVPDALLEYNGLDAFYTLMLFRMQKAKVKNAGLENAVKLFHEGIQTLARVQATGVRVDKRYLENISKNLEEKILKQKRALWRMPELKTWKKKYGDKTNIDSPRQLASLLHKELGFSSLPRTKKNNICVDAKTLSQIDTSFIKTILGIRSLRKARDTYVASLLEEQVNGLLHPSYNLHFAATFRSSCSNPNFQNLPVHDPVYGPMVRKAVLPLEPTHQLGEVDYSSLEVRVSACYHKDPTMIEYIKDPTKDMHMDMTCRCFLLKPAQVTKEIRFTGKNKFVFPEFYGAFWKSIAPALWNAAGEQRISDGKLLLEHLHDKGLLELGELEEDKRGFFNPKTNDCFYAHIRRLEIWFWTKKFPVYAAWRKSWYDSYLMHGSFRTLTGFRCSGKMCRTEVINFPVQGSAFHCLLWSLIQIQQWLDVNEMKTKIIGQVHDSIVFSFHPDEVNAVLKKVQKIMCEDVRRHWPWIIVPLAVEAEIAPPGKSWTEMKPVTIKN